MVPELCTVEPKRASNTPSGKTAFSPAETVQEVLERMKQLALEATYLKLPTCSLSSGFDSNPTDPHRLGLWHWTIVAGTLRWIEVVRKRTQGRRQRSSE